MKKLLTLLFVAASLTSYGQYTKPQLFSKIDQMSTYKVDYMKSLCDSIVKSMQLQLVSGTSIKTIESSTLLGSGNIDLAKGDVGLDNVDNTSDANKPVSTAQQTALNLKANLVSPTFTGSPIAPTQPLSSNNTTIATTEYVDRLALTISTGLTNTAGVLTNNVLTGVSGGQTFIGGTASGNNMTLSTTSNATKGNFVFGTGGSAWTFSEVNRTFTMPLGLNGSTMSGSWTGTASGQSHFAMAPTITGRSNAAGGGGDIYSAAVFNPTFVLGSGATQRFRGIELTGAFAGGAGTTQEALFVNPVFTNPSTSSYLFRFQANGTDRFVQYYDGEIAASGTIHAWSPTTRVDFTTPKLTIQGGATNQDFVLKNSFGAQYTLTLRNTSSFVGSFFDGSNTYFTTTAAGGMVLTAWRTGYVAKTALYTLTLADHTVEVTSGTHTQTLPTAVGVSGKLYYITNSGSGTVTVGTTSSQTFVNISGTPTTLTLTQFKWVQVQSNGANWLVLSQN